MTCTELRLFHLPDLAQVRALKEAGQWEALVNAGGSSERILAASPTGPLDSEVPCPADVSPPLCFCTPWTEIPILLHLRPSLVLEEGELMTEAGIASTRFI